MLFCLCLVIPLVRVSVLTGGLTGPSNIHPQVVQPGGEVSQQTSTTGTSPHAAGSLCLNVGRLVEDLPSPDLIQQVVPAVHFFLGRGSSLRGTRSGGSRWDWQCRGRRRRPWRRRRWRTRSSRRRWRRTSGMRRASRRRRRRIRNPTWFDSSGPIRCWWRRWSV